MISKAIRGPAACSFTLALALAVLPVTAPAQEFESRVLPNVDPVEPAPPPKVETVHPFAALAGTWTGGGTIALTGEIKETIRCRATYAYGKANNSLALNIRCASDNYKFELSSNVTERGGQFSGQWSETAYKVSGSISGRVNGGRIVATARGDSFTAAITVNTNGNRQSVTITPEATYIISVQIGMSRAAAPATASR